MVLHNKIGRLRQPPKTKALTDETVRSALSTCFDDEKRCALTHCTCFHVVLTNGAAPHSPFLRVFTSDRVTIHRIAHADELRCCNCCTLGPVSVESFTNGACR